MAESSFDQGVSLGVDIVDIARMRQILDRTPAFRTRMFSEEERAYCDASATPESHYATRFAAKEAVVKAIGTGFAQGASPRDIEVAVNSAGKPYVKVHGGVARLMAERGIKEVPISLSHTHTEAVACAMAITFKAVEAASKPPDAVELLTQKFKEARKILDEA